MKNKNKRTRTKKFWFNHFYIELIVMQLLWLMASSPFFSDSGCLTVMMFSVMYWCYLGLWLRPLFSKAHTNPSYLLLLPCKIKLLKINLFSALRTGGMVLWLYMWTADCGCYTKTRNAIPGSTNSENLQWGKFWHFYSYWVEFQSSVNTRKRNKCV